jgi:hypothetical protein
VVAKYTDILPVSKRAAEKFEMERFVLKKLSEMEAK